MTTTSNKPSPLHRKTKLAKSLERDVLGIALEHGRRVGSEGHTIVEEYLLDRLDEIGCEPYTGDSFSLPYVQDGEVFTNIVGVVPGKDRSKQPLLIGAHYDSVIDAPCADDNAAAVAIALAVAELTVANDNLERDLVVAIFDAEEPPYFQTESMGSNRFYEDQMKAEGVHAAIIMDLVGHDLCFPGEFLAAVPGVGIVILTMILVSIDVPAEAILFILPVNNLLDMCRTTTNVMGDMTCAVYINSTMKKI